MKNYFLMSQTARDLLFVDNNPSKECLYSIEKCPVCESQRKKKLFQQWNFNYFRCENCGFIFSNPRLTSFGAFKWYNFEYYKVAMKMEYYLAELSNPYYSMLLNQFHYSKTILKNHSQMRVFKLFGYLQITSLS